MITEMALVWKVPNVQAQINEFGAYTNYTAVLISVGNYWSTERMTKHRLKGQVSKIKIIFKENQSMTVKNKMKFENSNKICACLRLRSVYYSQYPQK